MTMITSNGKTSRFPVVSRVLDVAALLSKKSHFLFGPRQTGKSHLIRHTLPSCRLYDLLDTPTFLALSQNPARLGQEIPAGEKVVAIDEIQRLPELLNEVHRLIEERHIRFLLTGSSARKLRRGGVNLLGGRARTRNLHPFIRKELGPRFHLDRSLSRGLLPGIYFSDAPEEDLKAYTGTYLQEEIVAEGAARNIPAFSRFLRVAALCNGCIVNFTNISNDAQVPRTTIYEYFDILRDTLILHELPAWRRSLKRKPIASSKYFFFDPGVARILQGRTLAPGTPEYGQAFETYLHHELRCWSDYGDGQPLAYWRSTSGFEVDFILGDHTAVEVKARPVVAASDLKPLLALREEGMLKRFLCVTLEPRPRRIGDVQLLPYGEFLDSLWAGEFQ